MINIDVEIATKLKKEKNASLLIEDLLRKHYEHVGLEKLSNEQIDRLIELSKAKKAINEEIEVVTNGIRP